MSTDLIKRAGSDISKRTPNITLWRDYYAGRHRLPLATKQLETPFNKILRGVKDNLIPIIVESVVARLSVTGFEPTDPKWKADSARAWNLWQSNRLDTRIAEVLRNAAIDDYAALMVWVDAKQRVRVYPQKADQIWWEESADEPGKVLRSVKLWTNDKGVKSATVMLETVIETWEAQGTDNWKLVKSVANPTGVVPLFPIGPGIGQIDVVVSLQDMLNQSHINAIISGEIYAFPQRVALGLDVVFDENGKVIPPFKPGPDRVFNLPGKPGEMDLKQLEAQSPEPFLKQQDNLRAEMARVSRTPSHVVLQGGDWPTGESLKTASRPFTDKIEGIQNFVGPQLADMIAFAVRLEKLIEANSKAADTDPSDQTDADADAETRADDAAATEDALAEFETQWEPATYTSELELAQSVAQWVAIGVPLEVALVRYGGWDQESAQQAAQKADEAAARKAELAMKAFDAGPTFDE